MSTGDALRDEPTNPQTPPFTQGTKPVLQLHNITHTFPDGLEPKVALDSVSLEVHLGELVAVMGPSGCGKTTLLNAAAGLLRPDSGQIIINDRLLNMSSAEERAQVRRQEIGIVFQHNTLISALTVLENLALPLELVGHRTKAAQAQAQQALESARLAHLAHRTPGSLSGGERQRVAVIAALAGERRLLMADEPTGALDSRTADLVMATIRNRIDAGAGGLLVTHDARQAAWADRIVFLKDGVLTGKTGPSFSQTINATRFGLGEPQ